ncbi:TPA: NUMOD4 motif-containing HNH endonuclease [Bacillus cereus]
MEQWKSLKGIVENGDKYAVSNYGEVKNTNSGRILKSFKSNRGYKVIRLCHESKTKKYLIHRLVALAFIPNLENKEQVNHKDGNKENNCIDNLEWMTRSENIQHAFDLGLKPLNEGEKHHKAKLTESDVRWIRGNYKMYDDEFSVKALAERFDVTYFTMYMVIKNKTWKHVV